MKKYFTHIFHISTVFIGTIVGAGLASGKEISQFFTQYGTKSFLGIILCGIFYITICSLICKISICYNLNSYSDLINKISSGILSKITTAVTTLFLISSASIILAGSGALLNQFFGFPKVVGALLMIFISLLFLLKGTDGLIEVNSFIVPGLISIITIITVLYLLLCRDSISLSNLNAYPQKQGLFFSVILYAGYNTLSASGVLVPLSIKIKNVKTMIVGVIVGSIILTLLCTAINLLLTINQPYIYKLEIPLLFVVNRFGSIIQATLLVIILLEMFSTEVSDIFSISKSISQIINISYKKTTFIIIFISFIISLFGFGTLISKLYPLFGALSLFFIGQCIVFFIKHRVIIIKNI
ncbi:transporter [Clostridium sp. BJN0001]|uniref:YkvI family membrane protein n=1 Tax=Clostridium sp. BJN0001 TaxID=2930219 RepID=UPI001FD0EC2C|nr:transporter [Clostridium sp. BJN0001]